MLRAADQISRSEQLERLRSETFDLALIGGGINGAAIARDAAMRGLRVAMVDRGDFAGETSSRSSKLIHGGLRYLPQLYNWRIRRRIHRRYGELMAIEREALAGNMSEEWRAELLERVDEIERATIKVKIPGSHAEALYALRQHLEFVRNRLAHVGAAAGAETPPPAPSHD